MSRQGFQAECQDCPTAIGLDYGQTIYNGICSINASVQAQVEVTEWARVHALDTGHAVKVSRYIAWDVELQHFDPEIWSRITGE